MRLTYSQTGDSLYIYLQDMRPTHGLELDSGTLVDLADDETVVGIEVMNPARDWPLDEIIARFAVPAEDVRGLRSLWHDHQPAPLNSENRWLDRRFPFSRPLVAAR